MHWFVLASRNEVKILTKNPDKNELKFLNSIINPLAQERRRSLTRKQAGRGLKTIGNCSTVYFSENTRTDPRVEAAMQFAREFVQYLEKEYYNKKFNSLTIVAEAGFLGMIKYEMSNKLKNVVTNWIIKDLQHMPLNDVTNIMLSEMKTLKPYLYS